MISITALQKRLSLLEDRPSTEPDLVEIVLAGLVDADLEVLQEASELNEAGYPSEEISSMMAERWPRYQEAVTHFHKCYQEAEKATQASRGIYGL